MSQPQDTVVGDDGGFDASDDPGSLTGGPLGNLPWPGRVAEFGREVRAEMRQVAWPTRTEVINAAVVVLAVLIVLVSAIFGLNWLFSHAVSDLLKT